MNNQVANLRARTRLTAGEGKEFEGSSKRAVAVKTRITAGLWGSGENAPY